MMTWLLIYVLSVVWVYLAVVTAVMAVDCAYTLLDELRWRY